MPIPIPINEVTGSIAVVAILGAWVFRKQFWRAVTNRSKANKPTDE